MASDDSAQHQAPYSIGGVAEQTGLSEHAIRIWEQRYAAVAPVRSHGNHRRYTQAQVRRLQLLRAAQLSGRSIAEVAPLPDSDLEILVTPAAPSSSDGVSQAVAACNRAVDRLDPWALHDAISSAVVGYGYVAMVDGLLSQVMRRVGARWLSGRCGPEHEHLATATFRTLLGSALNAQRAPASAPTLVAATLEGEQHELGILAAAVVAGTEGWRIAYLGPNMPAEGIANVALAKGAVVIVLGMSGAAGRTFPLALGELRALLSSDTSIFCGGAMTRHHMSLLDRCGATPVSSVGELVRMLGRIQIEGALP